MQNERQKMTNKTIIRLLKKDIGHYGFKRIIFSPLGINWLTKIRFNDLIEIVDQIKKHDGGLYVFLPFCHKYLGVNLKKIYIDSLYSKWQNIELCKSISKNFDFYPFKLHSEYEREIYIKEFNKDLGCDFFLKIHLRLIKEGGIPIKNLDLMARNQKVSFQLKTLDIL